MIDIDDLVRIATVDNEPAAEAAVALLRTEGIQAIWRMSDFAAAVGGAGGGAMAGPIDVLVLAQDEPRARELLG